MTLFSSDRNFGFGKQMAFAGKQALKNLYADGHYSTVAAHTERWRKFACWSREQGVTDLSCIDSADLARAYAEHIASLVTSEDPHLKIAVSTAQNRISSVNTVFFALRGDRYVAISPRQYSGRRSNVRRQAPASLAYERVRSAVAALEAAGLQRAAAVLMLARAFGARREEAVKANLDRWTREAKKAQMINVTDGTKGGRRAPRWINVGNEQQLALEYALSARPIDSANLIAPDESYAALAIDRRGEITLARTVLRAFDIPGYHDARAAYACQRYREIVGCDAPAVTGRPPTYPIADLTAREKIAVELGHGRIDVTVSYVGGRR